MPTARRPRSPRVTTPINPPVFAVLGITQSVRKRRGRPAENGNEWSVGDALEEYAELIEAIANGLERRFSPRWWNRWLKEFIVGCYGTGFDALSASEIEAVAIAARWGKRNGIDPKANPDWYTVNFRKKHGAKK